jgi:hypothetical protein
VRGAEKMLFFDEFEILIEVLKGNGRRPPLPIRG